MLQAAACGLDGRAPNLPCVNILLHLVATSNVGSCVISITTRSALAGAWRLAARWCSHAAPAWQRSIRKTSQSTVMQQDPTATTPAHLQQRHVCCHPRATPSRGASSCSSAACCKRRCQDSPLAKHQRDRRSRFWPCPLRCPLQPGLLWLQLPPPMRDNPWPQDLHPQLPRLLQHQPHRVRLQPLLRRPEAWLPPPRRRHPHLANPQPPQPQQRRRQPPTSWRQDRALT